MTRLERRNQKSYGMHAVSSECQNFLMMTSYHTPHRYKDPVMRSVFTHLLHSGVTEVVSTTGGRSVGRGAVQVRERESCFVAILLQQNCCKSRQCFLQI